MKSTSDIIIQSKRWKDAKAFYNGVLGFNVIEDSDRMLGFDTGSFTMYVEPGDGPGPVFEYEVDDVAQAKSRLLAQRCELIEENPAVPRCYLRDPFGILFNLTQRR